MKRKLFSMAGTLAVLLGFMVLIAGCTSTQYLGMVTPHSAAEVLGDNVQMFEGKSYDEAVVKAGEAGFEEILSYEGRNRVALFGLSAKVRVIARDADGIR